MRVGFDIGGTFTDVIVIDDEGRLTAAKVLSLLDRVGEDIIALVGLLVASSEIENFVHGTTIAALAAIAIGVSFSFYSQPAAHPLRAVL